MPYLSHKSHPKASVIEGVVMEQSAMRVYESFGEGDELTPFWGSARSRNVNSAIDVEHLSIQTLGDRALERELLVLFDRQASQVVRRLHASMEAKVPETGEASDLAHSLKGSALAVGARRVAKAAEALEVALKLPLGTGPLNARLSEIDAAVGEAGKAVSGLLASM